MSANLGCRPESGSALLEVMITIMILAVGLLGIAGLQARVYVMEMEAFQRAQAVVIQSDLVERIEANPTLAPTFVAQSPLGGSGAPEDCAIFAQDGFDECTANPPAGSSAEYCPSLKIALRDSCELSNALKGIGEKSNGDSVGGLRDGIACITDFESPSIKAFGRCQVGVQVDVAWRGRSATIIPSSTCGTLGATPLYSADDPTRRAVSTRIALGDKAC